MTSEIAKQSGVGVGSHVIRMPKDDIEHNIWLSGAGGCLIHMHPPGAVDRAGVLVEPGNYPTEFGPIVVAGPTTPYSIRGFLGGLTIQVTSGSIDYAVYSGGD